MRFFYSSGLERSAEEVAIRADFNRRVAQVADELRAVSYADRALAIAEKIRQARAKGQNSDELTAAVKRGNQFAQLRKATEMVLEAGFVNTKE